MDDPVKQMGVDLFGQGISGIDGTFFGLWLHHRLRWQDYPSVTKPAAHVLHVHAHQVTEYGQVRISGLERKQKVLQNELSIEKNIRIV